MRILILGGTTEASALARRLAPCETISATLSLAGRTKAPSEAPIPTRTGGFGGIDGLAAYLRAQNIDVVIDATHPFASQMSRHAAEACARTCLPRLILTRAPWTPVDGDRWTEVPDLAAAAQALGDLPQRVFLTVGRLGLAHFAAAPQHHYLVRTIDAPDDLTHLPRHELVRARGPFSVEAEEALMRDKAIDVVVTKNSGGPATEGKLVAARHLGLPVILAARPSMPAGPAVEHVDAALAWIEAHRPNP
jgi:precorrin-6A/cobalt-precorrin-6A reductase